MIVFTEKFPGEENQFYPYFNDNNEIEGSQWNLPGFRIKLARFKEREYQFHSDITSSGYKKYYTEDLEEVKMILFESKLSRKIQANHHLFNKTERLTLLEESFTLVTRVCENNHEHGSTRYERLQKETQLHRKH